MEKIFVSYQLRQAGVPETAYSFNEVKENAYHVMLEGKRWKVFAFELGKETDIHYFETESAACRFLLGTLVESHGIFLEGYAEFVNKLERDI